MANDYQPESYNSPSLAKTFTGVAAETNLRAQSGYPKHCPQRLDIVGGAAGGDIVFKDIKGNENTVHIPIETIHTIDCAVSTLEAGTADELDITAYWWIDGSTVFNP